jgi:hypothetical protein
MKRHNGTIELTANGTVYRLVFNTRAMEALEVIESTKDREVTYDEVMARVMKGSVRAMVSLLWSMSREHHPEMTRADMARLIDDVGGLEGVAAVVQTAIGEVSPDAADVEALGLEGTPARPHKAARAGRGGISTGSPAAPGSAATSSGR